MLFIVWQERKSSISYICRQRARSQRQQREVQWESALAQGSGNSPAPATGTVELLSNVFIINGKQFCIQQIVEQLPTLTRSQVSSLMDTSIIDKYQHLTMSQLHQSLTLS